MQPPPSISGNHAKLFNCTLSREVNIKCTATTPLHPSKRKLSLPPPFLGHHKRIKLAIKNAASG